MSTIPYTLKFNRMAQWARQQSLFKLRDTYVAYGVRGLNKAVGSVMCTYTDTYNDTHIHIAHATYWFYCKLL